jgi:glycosyltransferase involved in cell wall biosynthesis
MRVSHVITRLIIGGAQENTIASVLGLRTKPGLEVDLIAGPTNGPEGSLENVFDTAPGLLTRIPELVRPVHPWKDFFAFRRLKGIFQHRRPDLVHTHSGKAGFLGRLAAAHARVPMIIHTIHGPSFGPFQGAFVNGVLRAAERRAARVTSHFITVADAMTRQYLRAGIGHPGQYTRIFSGFPLSPFLQATNSPELRARLGILPDDIVVGKIARLFKLKGHDDLFAIASRLVRESPRLKFLIVGDGTWRARFENQARALGLERHFVFTGLVSPSQIPGLVGIMDILVHLSLREGLARALPQALAAARPVVAYDCDGAGEVCFDGRSGFLIRPGHLNSLVERLLLLARDPGLRAQFGKTGREFVRQNFAVETMVDNLYSLYVQLADAHGLRIA